MAYISYEPEKETARQAQNLLELYRDPKTGGMANILRIHAKNPGALRAHFDLYSTLMFARSALTRMQREMIGVVVSTANACHY